MRSLCCFLVATILLIVNVDSADKFVQKNITLIGTARDVWPCSNVQYKCGAQYAAGYAPAVNPCNKVGWACHPNFESVNSGSQTGIVQKNLNATTRKPIYNNVPHSSIVDNGVTFDAWYNKNEKYNLEYPVSITLYNSEAKPLVYSYYSSAFYPLDNMGFGNYFKKDGVDHNYGFTFEIHSNFYYNGTETFDFAGDDDVWVFINNVLAIDLGGVHGEQSASIQLNKSEKALGIEKGNVYNFDFFFAERHTSGSNLKISTSFNLTCKTDRCGVCDGDGQSCCTCTDNNLCTKDTCDVDGKCIFTEQLCNRIDQCYTASCNATHGCVQSPVICDDGNLCTTDSCNPKTGCVFTSIALTCNASDSCHTAGVCNPSSGTCTNPVKATGASCDEGVCDATANCIPYLLLTDQTSKVGVTQSTWLPIWFKGLTNITNFQIKVLNFPALFNLIDDGNYTTTMIKYPGNQTNSMPYKFNGLVKNDTDFVAVKFLPSQTSLLQDVTLAFQVAYKTSSGRSGVNNHTITIPVEQNLLSFKVLSDTSLGYNMKKGSSQWFVINMRGLQRLLNFRVTLSTSLESNAKYISIGYPLDNLNNTRNFTSLYFYDYINVNVEDFFAFRVDVAANTPDGLYDIVATAAWTNGTISLQLPLKTFGLQVGLNILSLPTSTSSLKRQSGSSNVDVYPETIPVNAGSNLWSAISIKSQSAVSGVNVQVNSKIAGAVAISYPKDAASASVGDLRAGETSFAVFRVNAPEGLYQADVTVSYVEGGNARSFVKTINIKAASPSLTLKTESLSVDAGQSSFQSFGYSSLGNVSQFQVNLDYLPGWTVRSVRTTTSSDDWFATLDITAPSNASGYYMIPVSAVFTNSKRDNSDAIPVPVYVRASTAGPTSTGTPINQPDASNSVKKGLGAGATAGIAVGVVAVVAVGVVAGVIVVRRRRFRRVSPGKFRFKDEGRRSSTNISMNPPQPKV